MKIGTIDAIITQLREARAHTTGWISDGSTHKTKTPIGKMISMKPSIRGLIITLDTGRTVCWRMSIVTARKIIDYV